MNLKITLFELIFIFNYNHPFFYPWDLKSEIDSVNLEESIALTKSKE